MEADEEKEEKPRWRTRLTVKVGGKVIFLGAVEEGCAARTRYAAWERQREREEVQLLVSI